MKRTLVCALALVGLACSDPGTSSSGGNGGSGGSSSSTTEAGGSGGNTETGSGGSESGGTKGSGGTDETGGVTGSGGSSSTVVGGRTGAAGNTAQAGRTGAGGRTVIGGRTSAGGNTVVGGRTGAGGSTAPGGSTGTPGEPVTSPTPVDVTAKGADLPKYYISPKGDDSKSGTSPAEAWKTVTNIPKDKPSMVHFEKGGTFTAEGGPARGRDGPAAFNSAKGSIWTSYGEGEKRPLLVATEKTAGKPTGGVLSPGGDSIIHGISITGKANFGFLIMTDNNVIQDCEIDGEIEGSLIQLGISVRGKHNLVVGNYVHSLHEVILDSGTVNTSGGAEGIVINGTDHEIAYNTLVDLWTPNETLGGAEGGCLEIIARAPGEVVENVIFHHNHCERSVGLFEACAGNFAGTRERIQEHHAVVRNTTLAYNVVVDAMWLYLLQPVNTDMDNLIFEHNTLIHGPANTDIPQRGAPGFGNFYDTDMWISAGGMTPAPQSCSSDSQCNAPTAICFNGSCAYQAKIKPGDMIVRNNLFIVLPGAKAATMKLPPMQDVMNNIFSPKAPSGVTASEGKVTIVSDPGLVKNDGPQITANSPAVDKAGKDSVKAWVDFDGNTVPCGSAPDVGAAEVCQ